MAKIIDEEKWRKDGRTSKISPNVEFDVKVVMVSPLSERDMTLEATNSNVIVVSNPESNKLVQGMRIVAEDGGFEEKDIDR